MRSEVKEAEDSGGKRERKKRGMQRAAVWWESGRRGRLSSAPLGGHPGDQAPVPRVLQAGLVLLGAAGTQQNLLAGRVLRNRRGC